MANFEHDSNSDGEWDDSWDTIWNEQDWELYLKTEKGQIRKYQKLYSQFARHQNRLDEVAYHMGWEMQSDHSNSETPPAESPLDAIPDQPYTLHKHPLFIASKALHDWLAEKWTQHVSLASDGFSASQALAYKNTLTQSDQYGLLAVTALDLGDYTLAIAYFKRGLDELNRLIAHITEIDSLEIAPLSAYAKHARTRIFDLREIWLRVIGDCRAAVANRFEDE